MSELIYSPGLEGIVAGETAVSTIAGGLQYRGYAIDVLAEYASFEEVAHLLLHGELPTRAELVDFSGRLKRNMRLPPAVVDALRAVPPQAPMMDILRSAASLLGHFDPDVADNSTPANLRKAERLLAQLPVVVGTAHRLRHGLPPLEPDPSLSLAGNILWLLSGTAPAGGAQRAMEVSLILYAEHEFNASTFTARVVASTLSDLHSAVVAAIGALKGPLHGGANERVMEVLRQVDSPQQAESWVRERLARKEKIMGFGHRVYKTGDPRAAYLKTLCEELAEATGNQSMEAAAATIERIVTSEKKLPANLDWPSARLYYYLGLPVDLYTPLFVLSRVTGWCAHIIEQHAHNRIIRPLARYTGPSNRNWVPLDQRR
jgi:2-methylcitrate synthase/citrate synthase II